MLRTSAFFAFALVLAADLVFAHGDAAPQPVDTTGLPDLPDEMATANPWRQAEDGLLMRAVEIGGKAFNSNCARCHGLEAISGGLAPDLRFLEPDEWGDEWFLGRVLNGYEQNGAVKMPPFGDILSQEAIWAIRTYIETRPDDDEMIARQDELRALRDRVAALSAEADQAATLVSELEAVGASFRPLSGAPRSVTVLDEAAQLLKAEPPKVEAAAETISVVLRD